MGFVAGDLIPGFGIIGFAYTSTLGAIGAVIATTAIGILTIIGAITTIKLIIKVAKRHNKKET